MKRLLMLVVWSACAWGSSTYYVSSSAGSDSYTATQAQSPTTPWQSLGKVNGLALNPGDQVLLARGDVWREQLAPSASGASGSPIVFDAYGSGPAPEITGSLGVSSWTLVSGNVWSAPLPAAVSAVNFVLFGTVWGTKQSSQAALQHDRDFYFSGGLVYVFPL